MASRILVNGKWKSQSKITGVQRYAQELINEFDIHGLEYKLSTSNATDRFRQLLWEQVQLARESAHYDTLFCPANMAPLALPEHVRLVTTLHCLRFYFHPENYSRAFVAWYRFAIPKIVERASQILTVSNTTAAEIVRVYPAAEGKVRVVYPGVSSHFTAQNNASVEECFPYPYWVFVGNAASAKNVTVLLRALSDSPPSHHLILVGVTNHQLIALCKTEQPLGRCLERVHALGHINDAHRLAAIVRGATALLAPSLYESFDLPLAEAMATGTPVIASDTTVHHEIGEVSPLFIPATCSHSWGQAMCKLAADRSLCDSMGANGIRRAEHFQWKHAARSVMNILEQ